MMWKEPKNSDKYYWTGHAKMKMRHYGLSGQRVTRVIRRPLRTQEGITGDTIAVVQPQSTRRGDDGEKTWSNEIWVMYQIKSQSIKSKDTETMDNTMVQFLKNTANVQKQIMIISVWRYPGKTNPTDALPDEIMDEIAEVV